MMRDNPYRPPKAPIQSTNTLNATTTGRVYPWVLFLVSSVCLFEGLSEWAFTIPFRHTYFPNQKHPYEILQVAVLLLIGLVGLVEAKFRFLLRWSTPPT